MARKNNIAKRRAEREAAEAARRKANAAKRAEHEARVKRAQEEAEAAREEERVEVARRLAEEVDKIEAERAAMEAQEKAEAEAALLEANQQLMHAARCGNYLQAKKALANGADANYANDDGETVLSFAVQSHDVMLVTLIIDAGGDVHQLTAGGDNLLSVALSTYVDESQQRNCAKVIYKLENSYGIDPNHKNKEDLSFADIISHKGFDEWYSDLGAAVIREQERYEAIKVDARMQCAKIFMKGSLELTHEQALSRVSDNFVMINAVKHGNLDVVQALVECGYQVSAKYLHAPSPLDWAASCGHCEMINYLYRHGAEIDLPIPLHHGATALHWAAESGQVDAIRTLMKLGADVNMQDDNGATPLYIAVEKNQIDAVKCLIEEFGADYTLPCVPRIVEECFVSGGEMIVPPSVKITPYERATTAEIKDYLKAVTEGRIKFVGARTEESCGAEDMATSSATEEGSGEGSGEGVYLATAPVTNTEETTALVGSRLASYLGADGEGFNVDDTTLVAGDLPHVDAE